MQKLNIDLGIKEYEICGNVLRINASDPNLYDRFIQAIDDISAMEDEMVAKAKEIPQEADNGGEFVHLMRQTDLKVKEKLNEVFGLDNDFDVILQQVNLMAVGENGERIITNLLAALTPLVEEGAKRFYENKANTAVAMAKANRAQRRAAAKEK